MKASLKEALQEALSADKDSNRGLRIKRVLAFIDDSIEDR